MRGYPSSRMDIERIHDLDFSQEWRIRVGSCRFMAEYMNGTSPD